MHVHSISSLISFLMVFVELTFIYKSLFTEKNGSNTKNTAVQAKIQTKRKQQPIKSITAVDTLHWSLV